MHAVTVTLMLCKYTIKHHSQPLLTECVDHDDWQLRRWWQLAAKRIKALTGVSFGVRSQTKRTADIQANIGIRRQARGTL